MEYLKNEKDDHKKVEVVEKAPVAKNSKDPIPVKESEEGKKQFLIQE